MNRLSKAILITLAALCAIGGVLLLCVNLYIQSPGTHARIQNELSKALKLPLLITNTSLSPWGELRISGITIPAPGGGNFLDASSFSARYRLIPLLRKQLVIYDMCLDHPKVVLQQNADGKWALPFLAKAIARSSASDKSPAPPKSHEEKSGGFEILLDGFRVSNGSVELVDQTHKRIAVCSDFGLICSEVREDNLEGSLVLGKLNYGDFLFLENVRVPFKYAAGELVVPSVDAVVGGGSLHGKLNVHPAAPNSPFTSEWQFDKVDAARLSLEAGGLPGDASGILGGTLELHGNSNHLNRSEGSGQVNLANAQFRQLEFFQTIGKLLQIEALANLRINSGNAMFHIADERVFVDSLLLQAQDLKLSGKGTVRFDGRLALDAKLAVEPGLVKKLPSFVRSSFAESDADGFPAIDFKVGGKADRPKTDLSEKLVGKKLGDQFDSLVSGLFGSKKKKDDDKVEDGKKPEEKKKKKKKDEPAAVDPAVPAAVPAVPVEAPSVAPSVVPPGSHVVVPSEPIQPAPVVNPSPSSP